MTPSHIENIDAPESRYTRPIEVISDLRLSRSEKLAILNRWEQTLQDRLRSSGEGMTPHDGPPGADGDAARVVEIAEALRRLDAVDVSGDSSNTATTGVASHRTTR